MPYSAAKGITAETLRSMKNDMFATKMSVKDITDEMHATGNSNAIVYLLIGMNTLLELLAKEAEKAD